MNEHFYLQKMGSGQAVWDSVSKWGVYCREIPFKLLDKVKAPAKRTWNDEHGDDEYIDETNGLYVEGYTMKLELGCKAQDTVVSNVVVRTAKENVRDNVRAFLKYLRESGMMNIYFTYTKTGRRYVRLDSVGDNATWKQGDEGWWFLIFEVTLKVNDPVTDVTLTPSSTSS